MCAYICKIFIDMRADNKTRFSLFSAFLAGLFLLVALGAQHNFSKKKFLSYEGDGVELSISVDDEGDNEWGLPLHLALAPGEFTYIERTTTLRSPKFVYTKQPKKELSEKRLYILFHQLRSHIG